MPAAFGCLIKSRESCDSQGDRVRALPARHDDEVEENTQVQGTGDKNGFICSAEVPDTEKLT